jgi:tetratricopeptide (TPR) repeat protein
MFRRRPRRRPPIRRGPARPREVALRALRQANRLMQSGQYSQAYPIYRRLADGAAEQGMPVRAAHLYLQAGRARLEMGSGQDAADLTRRAVQLLAGVGQVARSRALFGRAVEALIKKGYRDQALALRAEVAALTADSPSEQPVLRRGRLPSRCPSCGAPARADEVNWIDEWSAECAYCGTVIQAE